MAKKAFTIENKDFTTLIQNVEVLNRFLPYRIVRALGLMGIDLLARTQPRVPWDTGQLRRSGRVFLSMTGRGGGILLARGRKDGSVMSFHRRLSYRQLRRRIGRLGYATVTVSYNRMNERGQDIAVWTHENLLAYEERPGKPAATKPGTGPHYLRNTWNTRKGLYDAWLKIIASNSKIKVDVKKMVSIRKKGRGYRVDRIRLVEAQIREGGYYNF